MNKDQEKKSELNKFIPKKDKLSKALRQNLIRRKNQQKIVKEKDDIRSDS